LKLTEKRIPIVSISLRRVAERRNGVLRLVPINGMENGYTPLLTTANYIALESAKVIENVTAAEWCALCENWRDKIRQIFIMLNY